MKIGKVNIDGGNQQFADTIYNKGMPTDASTEEKEFINFLFAMESKKVTAEELSLLVKRIYRNEDREQGDTNSLSKILRENKDKIQYFSEKVGIPAIISILSKFGLKLIDAGLG